MERERSSGESYERDLATIEGLEARNEEIIRILSVDASKLPDDGSKLTSAQVGELLSEQHQNSNTIMQILSEGYELTEEEEAQQREFEQVLFGREDGKEGESYQKMLSNADIMDMLDGKIIKLNSKIFKLNNGEWTDELSKRMFLEGRYGLDGRYLFRALIDRLLQQGSKDEQMAALGFAKQVQMSGFKYAEVDELKLRADAAHMILNSKADIYASGLYKPEGHTGRGFTRQGVMKNIKEIPSELREFLFKKNKRAFIGYDADGQWNPDKKYNPETDSYDTMSETGKSRIDMAIEWIKNIQAGKAHDTATELIGKDKDKLLFAMNAYRLILKYKGNPDVQGLFGAGGIDTAKINNNIAIMLYQYWDNPNVRSRYADADEGIELGKSMRAVVDGDGTALQKYNSLVQEDQRRGGMSRRAISDTAEG